MKVLFVHGACAKNGSWWWHRTAALLQEKGVLSVAAELPSCGETGETPGLKGPGLREGVAAVRRLLQSDDEPTIVVSHSYGGIVTADAAAGIASVKHLLLVSSYLPEVGQSLSDFGTEEPHPAIDVDMDAGTFTVRPDALLDTFMQDCDDEVRAQVHDRIALQSVLSLGQPVEAAAWKDVPSTYLVCRQDRGTSEERQREYAQRAGRVVDIDAGHHPFLSQPAVVRDLVLSLA